MISQEDMNALKEFEKTFDDAVNRDFTRNLGMKTYRKINDIYEHITGSRYKGNGWGCPACNFKFIKTVGKMYFDELKRIADEKAIMEKLNPTPAEPNNSSVTKKTTKPATKKPQSKRTTTKKK